MRSTNYPLSLRLRALATACLLLFSVVQQSVNAAEVGQPNEAQELVMSVAKQIISVLSNRDTRPEIGELRTIVDKHLVPHINFRVASGLVLGKHWKDAGEAQRVEFINQFRAFLVRFYTEALASYTRTRDVPASVMKFNEPVSVKTPNQVFVTSNVQQPSGNSVPVVYRMIWNDSWQVIDVKLSGISMVKTYRANFMSTVETQGLDVLITQLTDRNQALRNKPNSH